MQNSAQWQDDKKRELEFRQPKWEHPGVQCRLLAGPQTEVSALCGAYLHHALWRFLIATGVSRLSFAPMHRFKHGGHHMSETLKVPQTDQSHEQSEKYFSFQIKGWTNFDPMDKTLATVAERIKEGEGFLTLVEVLKVEDQVAAIDDAEVRECFENLLAAKRLIQNVSELPAKIKEDLFAALRTAEEIVPKKTVTLMPDPVVKDVSETRAKRWP